MKELIYVFLGGGLGSALRYFLFLLTEKFLDGKYYGTFIANVISCFFIGFILGSLNENITIPNHIKSFIVVGFLGGLSTFSTFTNESYIFLKNGDIAMFSLYFISTILLTFLAVYLGYFITQN